MNFRDDRKIEYKDGDETRVGTICRHNFPVEDEILNKLKFKVGNTISTKNDKPLEIVSISYDLFKGRVKRFIRYEFSNYTFIWVQNEDDYEIVK